MNEGRDRSPARVGWILATVALTTMLAPLNSTMIGVALPLLNDEFQADLAESGWLVIAYLIVMASLQPVAGKVGDRVGQRRMILVGLGYFAVASVGAALAPDLYWLLAFRIQQAIAGAIALPNGTALMRQVVSEEKRARYFGLVSAAVTLAAAAGPPLGGVLIEWAGWRAIFWVNLVFILPTVFLGWRVLPLLAKRPVVYPFDWRGALMLLGILAGGAALLTWRDGWGGASHSGGLVLIACLGVLFLRRQWRHPDPVFQPRFFRRRSFAAASAAVSLGNLAMYTTFLAIPLLLADTSDRTTAQAGLVLAVLWAPTVVCAPLGGRLADRWGRRWPTVGGLALLVVGLWMVAGVGAEVPIVLLAGGLAVAGIGLGLSSAGKQTAAVEAVPGREAGQAAGMYSTSRYVGSIVGSSLLPLLYGVGSGVEGFGRVLVLVLVAAVLAVVASLFIEDRPTSGRR